VGLRTRTLITTNRLAAVLSWRESLGGLVAQAAPWRVRRPSCDVSRLGWRSNARGRQAHELMSKGKP
jgi:hypothetical protein